MKSGPSIWVRIPEEAAPDPGEEDSIVAKTRHAPALHVLLILILAVAAALSAARAEYANPHGVAVIIGNKAYRNERVPEVAYAHRDAEAFRRFVLDVLGFNPDNLIDLRDATQAEMETAFGNERSHEGRVWRYLHPRHGSDVLVFYSGHGVPGLKDRRGYLLPVDADPDSAEINGYPIDLLYANLGKLDAAKSVRVFLEACFSGDSDRGMLVRSASPVFVQASLPEASGDKLTVLAAASGQEVASWDDEAEHGLFTHHLLNALYGAGDADGDGRVTATEAKLYLDDTMTIAARREFGRNQYASLNGVAGAVLARVGDEGAFPPRPVLDEAGSDVARGAEVGKRAPAVGGGTEPPPPPPVATAKLVEEGLGLTYELRVLVQQGLASLGEDVGAADGVFGRRTRGALRSYQRRQGLPETGHLTVELRDALVALGEESKRMLDERRRLEEQSRQAERERRAREEERRLAEEARRKDDSAFERAKSLGTIVAYEEYLESNPSGRHVAEARTQIAEAKRPKTPLEGPLLDAAKEALSNALSVAEETPSNNGYYVSGFSNIALSQSLLGDMNGAKRSFSKALSSAERFRTEYPEFGGKQQFYLNIAMSQAEFGDVRGAKRSISKAQSNLENISEVYGEKTRTIANLARALAKVGDFPSAKRLILRALSNAETFDNKYAKRTTTFSLIAMAQAEVGDIHGAERSISKALPGAGSWWFDHHDLSAIAVAQADIGDIHGALRTAERITYRHPKITAFSSIALAQAEAGEARAAERSISKVLSEIEHLNNRYGYQFSFLSEVALARARLATLPQ